MTGPSKDYSLGVKFTADETGMQRIPLGGTIKFAAFTDVAKFGAAGSRVIPAGTPVKRDADNTLIPADGTEAAGTAFLTATTVVENPAILRGSSLTTGLYAGGPVYEARIVGAVAGALPAGLKTALGPNFIYAKTQGSLVVGN